MGLSDTEEGAISAGFILNGFTFLSICNIWGELLSLFSLLSVPPQLQFLLEIALCFLNFTTHVELGLY